MAVCQVLTQLDKRSNTCSTSSGFDIWGRVVHSRSTISGNNSTNGSSACTSCNGNCTSSYGSTTSTSKRI